MVNIMLETGMESYSARDEQTMADQHSQLEDRYSIRVDNGMATTTSIYTAPYIRRERERVKSLRAIGCDARDERFMGWRKARRDVGAYRANASRTTPAAIS